MLHHKSLISHRLHPSGLELSTALFTEAQVAQKYVTNLSYRVSRGVAQRKSEHGAAGNLSEFIQKTLGLPVFWRHGCLQLERAARDRCHRRSFKRLQDDTAAEKALTKLLQVTGHMLSIRQRTQDRCRTALPE
jgi:hypothetical protein